MNNLFIIGDSLAKGIIYDESDGRYRPVGENIALNYAQKSGLQLKNFGMFGATVGKVERVLARHEQEIGEGDLVIIECGGNDSDFDWGKIAQDPAAAHVPMTPLERFAQGYAQLVNHVRALGATPLLINLPPVDAKRYFSWIARGKNAQNILSWLGGSEQYIYCWHEMYNMCVCRIAAQCHAALVDIRSAFLRRRDYAGLLCADGIHPNESGYRLIYDEVAGYLR